MAIPEPTANPVPATPARLERLPVVLARIGLSRAWLYRQLAAGRFPPPIKLGRATVWDARAVDRWIDARSQEAAVAEGAPQ